MVYYTFFLFFLAPLYFLCMYDRIMKYSWISPLKLVWKKVFFVVEIEKKKVTLSIPVETNGKLEELAQKYGMTKSGLVNFLINQVSEAGTIYK